MTTLSNAASASIPPAPNSSRALVTAGNRKRGGPPACPGSRTQTALAPVTWPRCTRQISPSSTYPAGARPAALAGAAPRTSGPHRPAALSLARETGRPPPSSPSPAGVAVSRSRIDPGLLPGRKHEMADVTVASGKSWAAGSSRCTDWPPSSPSSSERTRLP